MDSCEATKMVMSRIQALDPENASKIMGYILIQDQGEKEMIRLAFGPENLLVSIIKQAKAVLDISSNGSSAPSSPSLYNSTNTRQPSPFPAGSPRIIIPNNGFHHLNPGSPSSPWSVTDHRNSPSNHHLSPRPPPCSLSYAAVVNGGGSNTNSFSSPSAASSFSLPPFYNSSTNDLSDEFGNLQLQDQLPFLDESKNGDFMDPIVSPGGRSDSILFPYGSSGLNNNTGSWADSGNCGDAHHHHLHRRSCSVSDVFLGGGNGAEDGVAGGGFGWRPCMYFARGFCKNGNSCKFLHGGFGESFEASSPTAIVGSPGKIDGFEDLLRMKAIQQQQQRIAAMAGAPFPYSRCINFLNDNQRSAAAALMMGEEFHKFGRCRPDRNDFVAMGLGGNANSSSRQIYLTFPADSTFKEEDVSNYFSIFGPVQDVRIPYQQKRMFGFVTFVYPETVKQILAKGNPHFVCDSRVLVKPYKEKGKIPDKKQQQQQMDRGDFSVCLSPTGLDSVEPFDHIPFGARMFNHEMMLRRKIEERELQQAIDRRMMNLQLTELQNQHHNQQLHPNLSVAIQSPTHSHSQMNHNLILPPDDTNEEDLSGDSVGGQDNVNRVDGVDTKALPGGNDVCSNDDNNDAGGNGSGKEESSNVDDTDVNESLELNLPDNLFASPTKSASDCQSIFSPGLGEAEVNDPNASIIPSTSSAINMAALKSCYFQMPRSFVGQEAIEM